MRVRSNQPKRTKENRRRKIIYKVIKFIKVVFYK